MESSMHTHRFMTATLLASVLAVSAESRRVEPQQVLAFTNVTLIDGTCAPPRPNQTLVVDGAQIADVFGTGEKRLPRNAIVQDLRGRFVIPGLFDAHVHVAGGGAQSPRPRLQRALRGGVTTVRSMVGNCRVLRELARQAALGEIESPDIYFSAFVIGPAGANNPRRGMMATQTVGPGPGCVNVIEGELDPVALVGAAKGTGATALKLYGDLSASAAGRITEEAHRQGLKVWAHAALIPARPGDLVRAGVDVLSHAPYLIWEAVDNLPNYQEGLLGSAPFARVRPTDPAVERLLRMMAERSIILDATLLVYRLQAAIPDSKREAFRADRATYAAADEWSVAVTRRAREMGVLVAAGTDAIGVEADGELPNLHRELELLVDEAGFSPLQAIAAATNVAARTIGIETRVGTIARAKQADLVVLAADPAADIRNTRQIVSVVKRGKLIDRRLTPPAGPDR
jgi:imidazolonepropionase-like amidohydrolase